MMMKNKLATFTVAIMAVCAFVIGSMSVNAATNLGLAAQGKGTIVINTDSEPGDLLAFSAVPDFNFGEHSIMGSLTGLHAEKSLEGNLQVKDFRQDRGKDANYHVTAEVSGGSTGFHGAKGGNLTTANVAVTLGQSEDGTFAGVEALDISTLNTIANGTDAYGIQTIKKGTAALDITNISGVGALTEDTYTATINYTLVAGL